MSKNIVVKAALVVAVLFGSLLVAPAPAQAATCSTWAPFVGARQNRYGMTVRGPLRSGVRYHYRVQWAGISSVTYSDPDRVIWRTRRTNVSKVTGYVTINGFRLVTCREWNRPRDV